MGTDGAPPCFEDQAFCRHLCIWRGRGHLSDPRLKVLSPIEEELRKLREETNAEMLRQELDRERQRRMELEQKIQEVLKPR